MSVDDDWLTRAYYADGKPPWHSRPDSRPWGWRWSPDIEDPDTAQKVLDSIQQRGALVEVWVWSDVYQGKPSYARIEGVRDARMPVYFHQFHDGEHTYNRCIGVL